MTGYDQRAQHAPQSTTTSTADLGGAMGPGKTTLVSQIPAEPVQRRSTGQQGPSSDAMSFATGPAISGGGNALPHGDIIQRLFGHHDVSGVKAHVGGAAAQGAAGIGATAYATGNNVAFASQPDLATAAHEAAHVVQQRSGVQLKGGIDGGSGDPYEQHADAVAAAVVRGESAEALLDRHAGGGSGGGGGGGGVQRKGNAVNMRDREGEEFYTSFPLDEQLDVILNTRHPAFNYGVTPKTDEQAEIMAGASYLNQKKRDWKTELAKRDDAKLDGRRRQERWQPWETYQHELDKATPGEEREQAPWFAQARGGYKLDDRRNQRRMNNILADRAQVDQEDPQQLMGLTYARDTMFTINSEAIEAHKAVLDARTDLNTAKGWVGDCLIVTMGPQGELRLKITGVSAGQVSWADVRFDGTVLPGAARNFGMAEGMPVEVWKRSDGVLTVSSNHNEIYRTYSWTGKLQSYAMYQASTRVSEGLGQHITMDATKRNRGPAIPLNDETFEETQQRKVHAASGTRALGYDRSIGPARSPVNIEDEDLGWDINVAPYRRLGGDTIFQEAQGYRSGRYDNHIMPAHMVDVNDTDWYLQQQEDKPNRFVGGRSNSTQLYLQSATVLYHQGKLSISDAMDVMAFVIADMVVSGEHSMPECMTTLVMAAGTTEPWDKTPMNLEGPKQTMHAWLRLVNSSTKANMKADAENALWRMLADPDHDRRLVRLLGIIRREF